MTTVLLRSVLVAWLAGVALEAFPATRDDFNRTVPCITFAVNVHDWPHLEESAATILRLIGIFEKHNVRGDFYFTPQIVEHYAQKRPDVIARLKQSGMGICYHVRPPHPTYGGFDDRLRNLDDSALTQTLRDYETYRLDPATGELQRDKPGGYSYVAQTFGCKPVVVSPQCRSPRVRAAVLKVYAEMGAKMVVAYHETGTKPEQPFEWVHGLLARPSDFSITRWGEDSFWWNVPDSDPVALLKQQLADWHSSRAPFITALIHENDFTREGGTGWGAIYFAGEGRNSRPNSPPFDLNAPDRSHLRPAKSTEAIFQKYEALVACAAERLRVVTSSDIVAMAAPAPAPQGATLNQPGPWDNDVIVYRSPSNGNAEKLATFERAGVPTVARLKDGRLIVAHQHFPENDRENFDKVAVHFSSDEGRTWAAPRVIQVAGLPEGMRFPFDPTLVPLPDGSVRLYFTGNMGRTFGPSTPAIHSAISKDGVNYTYEPGVRFGVEGRMVIDCAVALHNGTFHLIAPDNDTTTGSRGYHAISKDGLKFERVADVTMPINGRWLGNMQSDSGQLVFFGSGDGPWPVTSSDGISWKLAANATRIPGADPGAVKLRDGSWLLVVTGPPRPGTRTQRTEAGPRQEIRVERVESKYAVAPAAKPDRFVTGQDADLMLGGFGFNNTGGALRFNHPTGLATDGKALLMTDRWNNRVLIWKSAPTKNTPPDLVLGQPDFTQNNSGAGKHQLNWPGNVAITPDGRRIAVTDTDNDRILIWNSFPTKNGAAADIVLELEQFSERGSQKRFAWPWGVWTDGKKLAVVATHGSSVLIWNSFPACDNQPPDFVLRPRKAGTPRNVTSDGATFFAVSDHNNGPSSRPATMVWRTFPTSAAQEPDFAWGEWLKGTFTPDRKLILAGNNSIYIWKTPPRDSQTDAAVMLRPDSYRNGDGPDAVIAGGRLYVCNYNGNNVLAWNSVPTRDNQPPNFALGSDTPAQDTWAENFFIQNPVVATDGKSLFVSSDFNRKMFVWRNLPNESAAKPDLVFHLTESPWDNELHGSTLALAGKSTVCIWKKLPLNGEQPDVVLSRRIGSVELGELTGVAFDNKYFYLSDRRSESIYVWEGIPDRDSEPKFTLSMRSPGRLTSDGNYLCAAPFEGSTINLWRVSELGPRAQAIPLGGPGRFNLPSECLIADGRLIVCNRSFNHVDVWNHVEDALAGRPADAFLGATGEQDRRVGLGRNKLFVPGSLAWGGGYLWVGEFKFSTRILRFSSSGSTP
jgi:DNA-binding beta-propeller fold protein YncE